MQVFVEADAFLAALGRCMRELQALAIVTSEACLSDPKLHDAHPDSIWRPDNWLELLGPVAIFLRQAVMRFVQSSAKPEMQARSLHLGCPVLSGVSVGSLIKIQLR